MVKQSIERGRAIGNKSISIKIRRSLGPLLPQMLESVASRALAGDMQAIVASAALLQAAVHLEK